MRVLYDFPGKDDVAGNAIALSSLAVRQSADRQIAGSFHPRLLISPKRIGRNHEYGPL